MYWDGHSSSFLADNNRIGQFIFSTSISASGVFFSLFKIISQAFLFFPNRELITAENGIRRYGNSLSLRAHAEVLAIGAAGNLTCAGTRATTASKSLYFQLH